MCDHHTDFSHTCISSIAVVIFTMPHVWGFFLTMHLGWESHVWCATKVLHQLLSPEGKRLVSKYIHPCHE